MRRILFLAAVVAFSGTAFSQVKRPPADAGGVQKLTLPGEPGMHKMKFEGTPGIKMAYLLQLPPGYDRDPKKQWPMIMFMHGAGEKGDDLGAVMAHGPSAEFARGSDKFKNSYQFIVLSPQCPARGDKRWDQPEMIRTVVECLDSVIASARVDKERVYATGLSMGGTGTWHIAIEAADRFAAIAPLAAGLVRPEDAARVKYISAVWLSAGENDGGVVDANKKMAEIVRSAGGYVRNDVLPGMGHDNWGAYYVHPQFYEWLLSKKRLTPAERAQRAKAFTYTLPTKMGHYVLDYIGKVDNQLIPVHFTMYLPKGYLPSGDLKPVMVFFHDTGYIGPDIQGFCPHGPELELLTAKPTDKWKDVFPFIVISPRLPPSLKWDDPRVTKSVVQLLDEVLPKFRADKSRVYLSGMDGGVAGAAALLAMDTDRYAAFVPVVSDDKADLGAAAVKGVPTWAVAANKDSDAGKRLAQMTAGNEKSKLVSGEEEAKGAYKSQVMYDWVLGLRKKK